MVRSPDKAMKKTLKCKFSPNMPATKLILSKYYDIVETDAPDFAFFSGEDYQDCYKYDCVRILEMGENLRPDFNLFDYAYGFDNIIFGDRYLYYPLYANMEYRKDMEKALQKHNKPEKFYKDKKKFCAMVVSNGGSAASKRTEFFQKLCNYKMVDSAGGYLNNMPDKKRVEDKITFLEDYRFSMAFENSSYPGYATEKIVQAWAGGTIPIYWGDPTIAEQFNEKAFINCHNFDNTEAVIEEIKQINEDERRYLQMQKEPIYKDGKLGKLLEEDYYTNWLFHIVDQEPAKAVRRTNAHEGWGAYVERDLRYFKEMSASSLVRIAYAIDKRWNKMKR